MDPIFVQRVLVALQGNCDCLWWQQRQGDSKMRFYVRCNDTFEYACADTEEITPDNIDLLEQTYAEAEALGGICTVYADTLFVARLRKQLPLQEVLDYCKVGCPQMIPLFEAVVG